MAFQSIIESVENKEKYLVVRVVLTDNVQKVRPDEYHIQTELELKQRINSDIGKLETATVDFPKIVPGPYDPTIPPEITSALSVTIKTNNPFAYRITATNNPTSYSATGLPDGMVVNTSTGSITGTPIADGISIVEISATNSGGTGTANLLMTVMKKTPVEIFLDDLSILKGMTNAIALGIKEKSDQDYIDQLALVKSEYLPEYAVLI